MKDKHRRRALPGAGGGGRFLLNEKRNEIAKIELRARLGHHDHPNKSPGHAALQAERLKHDDPRLDSHGTPAGPSWPMCRGADRHHAPLARTDKQASSR